MSESVRTIVKCQDPGDDTGDVIVELPPDVLAGMDVCLGDSLNIELIDGAIVLRPLRHAETKS
ncbi:AbrB/MazE/SpoVT family DNA-binding domain-containing protein [Halopseudomonas pelagia]|uniref:AbrB family transcriptional regulator n=1 Tax=Halopseudomonas pelagia TaxID=553151 RepID=A0AA91Z7T9_9GAMM|nr:AbrB family transcriptional regulator [Halopseudomonas pelagia]QFY56439.1 AbrB/MazE/SpoVT family DNA-binding domain-containing protein [Halopseudomonas pelagia]